MKVILEALTVPRLREFCDEFHVARAGKRTRAELVAALLRGAKLRPWLTPVELLVRLRRPELRAICRAEGRSEVGRANADLIHTIVSGGLPPLSSDDDNDLGEPGERPLGKRRSFYDLEFSVEPGGMRMAQHFIRATLDEIKADLYTALADRDAVHCLCWYGATLRLNVYQHGYCQRRIDLHPYVTLRVEGFPEITFGRDGRPRGYDFSDYDENREGSLEGALQEGEVGTDHRVAWERIRVPALRGELVDVDDLVSLDAAWAVDDANPNYEEQDLVEMGYVPYGETDLEM